MNVSIGAHTRVARNSLINFSGQLFPLIVGILSIPFVIRGLGLDNFGLLSLAWMLLGYFTLFDLGLGRATTKFISAELQKESTDRLAAMFWTSAGMNFALGLIGGIVVGALSPVLAQNVFRIPQNLTTEASDTFLILAISVPVVLVSTAFRGTLEAAQRFDYVNAVSVLSSSLTYLLPVAGILLHYDIRGIVLLLMLARVCSTTAYLVLCLKVFPGLRRGISFDMKIVRRLISFGGWVSISNASSPILTYFDRFVIGSIISIAAVSYYTAPYEMVMRLTIVPTSLAMTLFPSFSGVEAADQKKMTGLFSRSVKFLLLVMGPLVAVLMLFSNEILHAWLGTKFADVSTLVFRILAIGILMNALAQIPYALIQGFGRPDITAKFHIVEVVIYLPLVWYMVSTWGIGGGAMAWTVRVTVDMILLYVASGKFLNYRTVFHGQLLRGVLAVAGSMGIVFSLFLFEMNAAVKAGITVVVMTIFVGATWRFVLDYAEKTLIRSIALRVTGMRWRGGE